MADYIAGKKTTFDRVHILAEHVHSAAKCYPTGAAGVTATATATQWTLGSFVQVVPASTIREVFDIHYVNIEGVSADAVYELVFYAATVEIARIRVASIGVPASTIFQSVPIQTALLPADTQIQAKVMSDSGNADTVTVSLFYHTY